MAEVGGSARRARRRLVMLSAGLPVLAAAVLTWPSFPPVGRLRAMGAVPKRRFVWRISHLRLSGRAGFVVVGVLTVMAWALGGPGVAIAVSAVSMTVWGRLRAREAARKRLVAATGMAEALRGFVAELRSGAHAASAAQGAVTDLRGAAAEVMSAVATAACLGGDVAEALRESAAAAGLGATLDPLARAWALAARHGLPLADMLDAVRRDLDGRVRFARQVRARMAGPRASGAVLGVLPVLGVLLGEAMGAQPLRVLFATGIGQALLAVGTVLACVGTLWIVRLTAPAVM